jgi:hypothetical protein
MNGSRRIRILATLLCAAFNTGCATLDIPWLDRVPEASAKNPVVQILCLWEPSEGRDPQGMSCRGFAGQLLFLGNKGGTPVKVDGEVVVSVFDDFGTPEEQALPLHQYRFDSGAWSQHLAVNTMGPTYHVFIPYPRSGNYEANCVVHVKLTPTEGPVITSNLSRIHVKGKPRHVEKATNSVSTLEPEQPIVPEARRARTTTIPLDVRNTQQNFRATEQSTAPVTTEQSAEPVPTTSQRIRFDGRKVERVEVEAAPPVESSRRPVSTQHPLFEDEAGATP